MRRVIAGLVLSGFVFVLSGCGTLNVANESSIGEKTEPADFAIIERYPDEPFKSGIKIFEHFELGILKKTPGSDDNCSYCWKRIVTPSGQVRIGLVGGYGQPVAVLFRAEAGQHYYTTVSCPNWSPCAVVIDANTNRIIASTCKDLVDTKLDRCNECFWLGGAARNVPTGFPSPLVLRRIPDECRSK